MRAFDNELSGRRGGLGVRGFPPSRQVAQQSIDFVVFWLFHSSIRFRQLKNASWSSTLRPRVAFALSWQVAEKSMIGH
jgi:hypothetical protein